MLSDPNKVHMSTGSAPLFALLSHQHDDPFRHSSSSSHHSVLAAMRDIRDGLEATTDFLSTQELNLQLLNKSIEETPGDERKMLKRRRNSLHDVLLREHKARRVFEEQNIILESAGLRDYYYVTQVLFVDMFIACKVVQAALSENESGQSSSESRAISYEYEFPRGATFYELAIHEMERVEERLPAATLLKNTFMDVTRHWKSRQQQIAVTFVARFFSNQVDASNIAEAFARMLAHANRRSLTALRHTWDGLAGTLETTSIDRFSDEGASFGGGGRASAQASRESFSHEDEPIDAGHHFADAGSPDADVWESGDLDPDKLTVCDEIKMVAVDHCQLVLMAILKGMLLARPTEEDVISMVRVIMGDYFEYVSPVQPDEDDSEFRRRIAFNEGGDDDDDDDDDDTDDDDDDDDDEGEGEGSNGAGQGRGGGEGADGSSQTPNAKKGTNSCCIIL